jgi:hypothetical protein
MWTADTQQKRRNLTRIGVLRMAENKTKATTLAPSTTSRQLLTCLEGEVCALAEEL